ncbi:hypothetical protein CPB83DRAFT_453600 [Crepidotus variabilis]|uniref:Uncharacterized protein n=1 Tax=Crepidotus variabilis TaxID=179855 RepID=A0A9P6ECT6_9AGAR|nr:hypothetical protein CPB83DRAFT_453600 [Crepidotus variabilis]
MKNASAFMFKCRRFREIHGRSVLHPTASTWGQLLNLLSLWDESRACPVGCGGNHLLARPGSGAPHDIKIAHLRRMMYSIQSSYLRKSTVNHCHERKLLPSAEPSHSNANCWRSCCLDTTRP